MDGDNILETRSLTKEFKGFIAVKDVNLQVRRGSIHALIGPNGAGKTTVFNLLTKFLIPSGGQILFNGNDITKVKPADIARQGLVRSFQISAVFPHLTCLENVRVALQKRLRGDSFDFWRSEKALRSLDGEADRLLESVNLAAYRDTAAVELPYGRKRALEIATTLALEPELMLLDEPMAGMGPAEGASMVDLLRKLKRRYTILLIEHDMDAVFALADWITVLVHGAVIATGAPDEIRSDLEVRRAYLGEETV